MAQKTVEFRWPPTIASGGGVKMRELTTEEVTMVLSAFSDPVKGSVELVKRALIEVDGIPVTPDNRDEVWARLSAKQRTLVQDGYRYLHIPSDEEREAFFASAVMGVRE